MEAKLKPVIYGLVALAFIAFLFYFFEHNRNGDGRGQDRTDRSNCPVPPAFHVSNDRTLEVGGVNVNGISVAKLQVQDIEKFYHVLGDQATNSLVVDYLICRSEERHELDPKDADAVSYYRKRTDYVVQTRPTADQLSAWDQQNPPPKKTGKLITPDFINENGQWVIVLSDPTIRREAKIENFGDAELTYVLGNVPEPQLWVLPRQQQQVAPHGESVIQIFLGYGAMQPEYKFLLQSSVEATPREIIVQVPKLAAVVAQQEKLTADLSHKLLEALPERLPADAASDKNVTERLIATAAQTVQANYPQLDESSRWVVTSQVLLASHWPSLALTALNRAEQSDASVAHQPALQRYAGQVGYLANSTTVFVKNPIKVADVLTAADGDGLAAAALEPNALINTSNQAEITKLIKAMQPYQALHAAALSLQGDLYASQRKLIDATATYDALVKVNASPSAAIRLTSVQAQSGNKERAKLTADKTLNLKNDAVSKKVSKYAQQDAKDRPIG